MIGTLFALHRQGLGSLLLAHLEKEMFKNHDALMLESFRDNDQANAFYRRRGWREAGAYRDEDYGVEMIRLRKEVQGGWRPRARSRRR